MQQQKKKNKNKLSLGRVCFKQILITCFTTTIERLYLY